MSDPVPGRAAQTVDGVSSSDLRSVNLHRGRTRKLLWQLQQVVALAVLAFGSYLLISHFLLQSVTVVGTSMVPTLADSERYLLNRWIFHLRDPQPSEVVVLRDPSDNGYSVKRVIGIAGDVIAFKDGAVYVNGKKLAEPYLPPSTHTFSDSPTDQVYHCGHGQFFLLGDNRKNSVDSRAYGPVPRQNILGLVVR